MAQYTPSEFRAWFQECLSVDDRMVVVYSGIWTFGHRFGLVGSLLPEMLITEMLKAVGPDRTLLLPAYTPKFTGSRVYSPKESLPETGVLPEVFFRDFSSERTLSALDSFLAIGPAAASLTKIVSPTTLWGEGSIYSLFEKEHARMVTLGVPWKDSMGILHRIEELGEVPYRYYKTFHGEWLDDGVTKPWQETMFVRSKEVMPIYNWAKVDQLLLLKGRIRTSKGGIFIQSADAAEITQAGLEIIKEDPYALLENANEVREWVERSKIAEIVALRQADPKALDYHDKHMVET
jgi:aminoglycoside N3'-acetyltransferase